MTKIKTTLKNSYHWQFDTNCFSAISAEHFTAKYWQDRDAIVGQESGRGTTWFIQHEADVLVLRHYLRGGMMRKISKERYLFTSLKNCRSIAEFEILHELRQLGLPVPKPAGAQVLRHGLFYQADLLTHRIPNAQDLVQVLQKPQNQHFYIALGETVAKFHLAGVYHADLNIQNILQDKEGRFWLIDFDRAKRLSIPTNKTWPKWQESNLKRLKRSFEKERKRYDIKWQENDWQIFHSSYNKQLAAS